MTDTNTTPQGETELAQLITEALGSDVHTEQLETLLETHSTADLTRAIAMLEEEQRGQLIDQVSAETAADLVEQLPIVQAIQLLEEAQPEQAAAVVDALPSDLQADLLSDLEKLDAEAILRHMQPEEADDARRLAEYDEYEAGGLMVTEFLRFPDHWTVHQLVRELEDNAEKYRDYQIQYAYVCGSQGELIGVLRLRDLLLGDRKRSLSQIMIPNPLAVPDHMGLDELHGFFQQHHFLGVPVVDDEKRLVGVLQRTDVDQAWIEQQDRSYLKSQGIVRGEEIRSMPLRERVGGRLSWLSINVFLNLMAATIISYFEPTLVEAIALTAFLPIISDMSGCSGNQAVAVSIRELMLGLAKPQDLLRVWLQEISVGCINGLSLGLLLGGIAWVWKGNAVLGFVVGIALCLNTMVAVSIGGLVPLILRRFGKDPAVGSGPLLTTVTDMCGFFLVLSIATWFLDYL
ncbi:MAG: magnesium transporter [bacterium]|nr:magnesium transporter [bacterium]